jgi:prepilin-type N-terminal cleavage/methylation domain-containing protein
MFTIQRAANRGSKPGFTMIELLIVVVVVGIIAAIAVQAYWGARNKVYVIQMKSDLHNLMTAEQAYFIDSGRFTNDLSALKVRLSPKVSAPTITVGSGYWSAQVTHGQMPGATCAIQMGTTFPLAGVSVGEGAPGCNVP